MHDFGCPILAVILSDHRPPQRTIGVESLP